MHCEKDLGWLNNDVKTEDFCCNGATNGKSIQEVKDRKNIRKIGFWDDIWVLSYEKMTKNNFNFKDFKIVVIWGQVSQGIWKKNGKWLQQEPAELKVIIYKSGGEPFLWNIIWYLAWLAELKTDQIS